MHLVVYTSGAEKLWWGDQAAAVAAAAVLVYNRSEEPVSELDVAVAVCANCHTI